MLRNGVWGKMPDTRGIAPKDGWLCLCTDIDTATKTWKEAQYEICEPSEKAYPIAKIEVKGETIRIRQCYVTVAIFNLVKRCPLAEL